jgi:hypothetical protein
MGLCTLPKQNSSLSLRISLNRMPADGEAASKNVHNLIPDDFCTFSYAMAASVNPVSLPIVARRLALICQ